MVVTISSKKVGLKREFELLRQYLKLNKETLSLMVKETCSKYPYLANDEEGIFLVAKEQSLKFVYNNDSVTEIKSLEKDLDVDLTRFLD